jgi:hypothetical protein
MQKLKFYHFDEKVTFYRERMRFERGQKQGCAQSHFFSGPFEAKVEGMVQNVVHTGIAKNDQKYKKWIDFICICGKVSNILEKK